MTRMENQVKMTAQRIKELRSIIGKSPEEMAAIPPVSILREFIGGQVL